MAARHNNAGSAAQQIQAAAQTVKADALMAQSLAADADYWSSRYPILAGLLHGDREKGTAGLLDLLEQISAGTDRVILLAQGRGE